MSIKNLQLKPIRNPIKHFHISFDVVELGDFRSGVAQQISYLSWSQGFDVAVFVLGAVDQSCGKGMAEAVEAFCFDACRLKDSVESFAEVDGAGDFAVLIRDERAVLAEEELLAEVFDHLYRGVVERDIALACGAL